jgi:hypothetical protein
MTMKWLFKRLSEPSTGAGVAIAAQLAKTVPALAAYGQVLDILSGLATVHAVALPEAGK